MRLIDADNLKAELFDANWLTDNDEHMVEEIVERQSTVDAEPARHGRYIQLDEDTWQCSACGVLWTFLDGGPEDNEAGYCPKCGAKMDGGDDSAKNKTD